MNQSEQILEKMLDRTAKKNINWYPYLMNPDDKSRPFQKNPNIVPEDSYSCDFHSQSSSEMEDGVTFFLVTLNEENSQKLIFGMRKYGDNTNSILSEDQQKLFELKTLIEYEEPRKNIDDILHDFLNDEY